MTPKIIIYQLRTKFVNQREDVPEDAKQVVYYTLAVGHHVGVMDLFSSRLEIPLEEFSAWVQSQPEGPARTKLEGALRWGEIEVNQSHVGMLLPLLEAAPAEGPGWTREFVECLNAVKQESAMYLMVRKVA
ncbi:MAG: formate hydrogenlyase maturation protein HycH [Anaerolineales bacterium]|jgi:Formate hydrogenlyase maturation protein HycH.|nr:MAG: formate hydrogenlyase maturation protein HycH [Anaerolineales bacterium]